MAFSSSARVCASVAADLRRVAGRPRTVAPGETTITIGFDAYSLVARILPGYVTLVPIALPLLLMPNGVQLSFGSIALMLPLVYFVAYQIGKEPGKRNEKKLWRKWGGAPTTRFLRHSNEEYGDGRRLRLQERLTQLGMTVPTPQEEEQDPSAADVHYEVCTSEIIRRTRNVETFPLVFRSVTSYGLQRNLWGLKAFGIVAIVISAMTCILMLFLYGAGDQQIVAAALALLVDLALLLIWVFGVNEGRVRMAAEEYARNLFEAALDLEPPTQLDS